MTPSPAVTGEHRPGDAVPACANVSGMVGSMLAAIELDNDENAISLGGVFANGGNACVVLQAQIPDVSTDRARIRFDATGSLNQVKSFYGPYFSIRPDPILGDGAPSVSITSTLASGYVAGTIVPIVWTASDDEALRSFDIRASFDGGTRWFIVARDIPGNERNYNWRLAASDAGIPDVRVRVVAKDRRFQNSSSEAGPFAIAPGSFVPPCAADTNADGIVNAADLSVLLAGFGCSN